MMTDKELLMEKVAVFSRDEILDKIIEELSEALQEALDLMYSGKTDYRALLEELADVDVAGRQTLEVMPGVPQYVFPQKVKHAIRCQIREAIGLKLLDQFEETGRFRRVHQRGLFDGGGDV
jgi:hypothetical protein